MRDVRHTSVENKKISWRSGWASHCFNNCCEDLENTLFKSTLKDALLVVKTKTNVGMIRNIFNSICDEKHNQRFSLPFYSKTRWLSANYMRAKIVGSMIWLISHAVFHKKGRRTIDDSFELPKWHVDAVSKRGFWKSLSLAHSVFDCICKYSGVCETKQSTMSTVQACSLNICMHISPKDDIMQNRSQNSMLASCINAIGVHPKCPLLGFYMGFS